MTKQKRRNTQPSMNFFGIFFTHFSSRMMTIQTRMTERAIELLSLPQGKPAYILDIGCGSGLSGETLTEAGHYWVGVDISPAMLGITRAS